MKLNEKYQTEPFINFIQDFLPEDLTLREEDIVINKDRYKEIKKAKILGFCDSLELHVLEMEHSRDKDPRVAIATDAFKILADHWIHRALVVFKNNDTENYRLSYLTISLDLNEKNKVVKTYSNARRYSFYLGTQAKVKTPEQQLIKKGRVKDADDLLGRFSVEVVNKQFYLEVAKFFDELVSIEDKNLILPGGAEFDVNIRKSFAVRLIGRAMFCWFLKQKKSDSGQLIPDEILSSKVVVDNYYHSTLEPLFFGVLNTSIEARDIRTALFDKVPYLNGGLFNPQVDDFYELDRGTFASKFINTLRISDKWFREFFELLETYNFTIDENTVFDQELSVDPEMLGRIFENLLAEINPETGSSERKRTGSFYTPRQIVEYMVDQSLIEYFKTKTNIEENKLQALVSYDLVDDASYPLEQDQKIEIINAIESLKILDPACGSGAYPIGALQKIVYILQQLDPDCTLWLEKKLQGVPDLYKQKIINEVKQNPFDYTRKLDVIKNSIFGVDIQPIAVDVSRLRCFLTLVVESEIDDSKPNRGIEPLPNLDFKFVCANTLIPLPKSENTGLFDDHSGISELSKIMSEYFSCNSQRKNELKIKFTNTQKEILEKTISAFGRNTGELTLKLTTWNPFSNDSHSWFDSEWMFGLQNKFDIVLANPPYIDSEGMVNAGLSDLRTKIQALYKWTRGNWDIYIAFFEFGFNHMNDNGVLSYITPDKWISKPFGEELRRALINNIFIIFKSGRDVFTSAKVDSIVTFISKRNSDSIKIVNYREEKFILDNLIDKSQIPAPYSLDYLFSENLGLLERVSKFRGRLSELAVCENACATSDAYLLKSLVIDLGDDSFDANKHLKIINTGTIGKYVDRWGQKPMTYLKDKYLYPVVDRKDFLSTFPNSYGKKSIKPKLIIKGLNLLDCCIDSSGEIVPGKTTLVITSDDITNLKFIMGILNSKFPLFYIKQRYPASSYNQGTTFTKDMINNLPIPDIDSRTRDHIVGMVDELIQIKKINPDTDTQSIENNINQILLELYGLTDIELGAVSK
jgi:adenine-specific DNA-methyltransferase